MTDVSDAVERLRGALRAAECDVAGTLVGLTVGDARTLLALATQSLPEGDMVERAAIAMFECDGGSADEWHDEGTTVRASYLALARAAIAAALRARDAQPQPGES